MNESLNRSLRLLADTWRKMDRGTHMGFAQTMCAQDLDHVLDIYQVPKQDKKKNDKNSSD